MRISPTTGIVLFACCLVMYAIPTRAQTVKDSWDKVEKRGEGAPRDTRSTAWPQRSPDAERAGEAEKSAPRNDASRNDASRNDAGRTVRSAPGSDRAQSGGAVNPAPSQLPPSSRAPLPESGAWQSGRGNAHHVWPSLPAQPTVRDYHAANAQVLDSLTTLYCLSANYLRALHARNDAGLTAQGAPDGRDFSYQQRGAAPAASARPSLDALHRELLELLDACVRPR